MLNLSHLRCSITTVFSGVLRMFSVIINRLCDIHCDYMTYKIRYSFSIGISYIKIGTGFYQNNVHVALTISIAHNSVMKDKICI